MNAKLKKLSMRVNALSLRERFLVFAVAIGVLGALTDYFFVSPLLEQQKAVVAQLDKKSTDMDLIRERTDAEMMSRSVGRAAELNAALAQGQREIDAVEGEIATLGGKGAGAVAVSSMLARVMQRTEKVTIVRIVQLGASHGGPGAPIPPANSPSARGGFEITLSGNYLDLMAYLGALEKSLPQARWAALNLKADTQPAQVTVRVITGGES